MKHSFARLMIVALMSAILSACGGSSQESNPGPVEESVEQGNGKLGGGESEGTEKAEDEEPAPEPEPEADQDAVEDVAKAAYVLDNYDVVNNDDCIFRIVEVKESGRSVEFRVYCENKTDKTLMFSINGAVCNGYSLDPFFACEVAPGKKQNDSFSFYKDDLDAIGITTIDELRFGLRVYDSDDWMADEFIDDSFTVYPTGASENEVVYPDRMSTANEIVLHDDANGTFVIYGVDADYRYGYAVVVFIENKTDSEMMVSWDDVSVNGYMCDPFWATSLPPHSKAYDMVTFSSSSFEENDIEVVEEIEFELKMYDYEDWMADPFVEETFTYSPV